MNAPTLPLHPEILSYPAPAALLQALSERFGAQYSAALVAREQHGRDESAFTVPPPAAVVFAERTQDVADAVKLAAQFKVPVIAFGVGSSLEGHLLAVQGGISIDVSRMNAVLAINAKDLTVTVQAGVTRKQLNEAVKSTGLFFPVDPGADATLGGMAATRASGTNAVRYGTMRENVLALEVVTAQGEVVRTGTRAKKSSAGYDLTRLMVGSEGTLGVITEVTVRLYPLPEAVMAATCSFDSLASAVIGRHLHRRTRRWPSQDGLSSAGGRRRGHRHDARHQTGAGPRQPHESGQDICPPANAFLIPIGLDAPVATDNASASGAALRPLH